MSGKVALHTDCGKTVKNALRKIDVGVKPSDGSAKFVSKFVICPSSYCLGNDTSVSGKLIGLTSEM